MLSSGDVNPQQDAGAALQGEDTEKLRAAVVARARAVTHPGEGDSIPCLFCLRPSTALLTADPRAWGIPVCGRCGANLNRWKSHLQTSWGVLPAQVFGTPVLDYWRRSEGKLIADRLAAEIEEEMRRPRPGADDGT